MKTVKDIRSEFLNFFAGNGHEVVQSSSLVPDNDPTLMFTNAGMVPFKNLFTGAETRDYKRATSSQKCVRAGGKHNDLENVGYTARHHTFFEMLGNFSFGDYFKEEAISYAWELLTKNFELPANKLLITVHSSDEEAAGIWKKITGFSDDKIIRIPTSDNFWSMGDTGPCGPCTEIFYDHGDGIPGGPPGSPDEDGDRFIEIWNLVFMQFETLENGDRVDLPKPCIDTGMGLERLAALLQGQHNNYETDLFRHIIDHVCELTNTKDSASHRVIADHLRASAFLMADGVMPSNEGRGYVLRRIMRRGMRHAHLLGAQDPLMHKLMPTLVGLMGEAYPELRRGESMITEMLNLEEARFKTTLERGLKLLDEETKNLGDGQTLAGDVAFKLYDTFGFPVDLTQDALRAQNIGVDMNGFETAMEKQRATARASWKGSGDAGTEKIWFEILDQHGPTEFLGYNTASAEAQILALVKDGKVIDKAGKGDDVQIVTNQSPFYAESGGQTGDTGTITVGDCQIDITDTRKQAGGIWVHIGIVKTGTLETGSAAELHIDETRRNAIQSNHSVTHLLHKALHDVLGDHVAQKGSLQDAERTRFDISHPKAVTSEQIHEVERLVNEEICANTAVTTRVLPIDEAMESGATALFGEKYDDEVRVVSMGTVGGTQPEGANNPYSVELCGGTHVERTGDIGSFHITSESAVSSGVRRINALTGTRVDEYLASQAQMQKDKIDKLKAETIKLRNELASLGGEDLIIAEDNEDDLVAHNRMLKKEISNRRRDQGAAASDDDIKEIANNKFIGKVLEGFPPKDLKPMVDDLKNKIGSGVVTLVATNEGKASIVVGVTADLTDKISAVDLVRIGSEALGGKGGGGRPDMAQAGGPDASAANDAVSAIEKELAS